MFSYFLNLCFGRRGSDSSIETKSGASGAVLIVGGSMAGGGGGCGEGGGGGGGVGGVGGGGVEGDEEAACHSLPLQVNYSAQPPDGHSGLWTFGV